MACIFLVLLSLLVQDLEHAVIVCLGAGIRTVLHRAALFFEHFSQFSLKSIRDLRLQLFKLFNLLVLLFLLEHSELPFDVESTPPGFELHVLQLLLGIEVFILSSLPLFQDLVLSLKHLVLSHCLVIFRIGTLAAFTEGDLRQETLARSFSFITLADDFFAEHFRAEFRRLISDHLLVERAVITLEVIGGDTLPVGVQVALLVVELVAVVRSLACQSFLPLLIAFDIIALANVNLLLLLQLVDLGPIEVLHEVGVLHPKQF